MNFAAKNEGKDQPGPSSEALSVLLVGNNPMFIGNLYQKLKALKNHTLIIDFSFDFKESLMKALRLRPSVILLDDGVGKGVIRGFIDSINSDRRTRDIPITVLKTSNYRQVVTSGVHDFLLKENLSAERLYHSIMNSIKFKRTARLLKIARRKKERQISRWVHSVKERL